MTNLTSSKTDVQRLLGGAPRGAQIVSASHCGTPTTLLDLVAEQATTDCQWTLLSGLQFGDAPYRDAVRQGRLRYTTWHVGPQTADLVEAPWGAYLPLRGIDLPDLFRRRRPDIALVRVSPPTNAGYVSLGTSVSYVRSLVDASERVIGEVDEDMPLTHGNSMVHMSRFAGLLESETSLPEYVQAASSDAALRIATHILDVLPLRPTLQMGIGAVPEAVTSLLADADLGRVRFVGMGSDAMVDLFISGTLDVVDTVPSPAVMAVELLGTRKLFQFASDNPSIGVYATTDIANPVVLSRYPRFVSINSALEVDLMGQCNAEWSNGRQRGGVGGSMEFTEGGRLSSDGLSIIAMYATRQGGSRIVKQLAPGTPVSIPRHTVGIVITEYGVADLRNLTTDERREALTAIAAPEFRGALAS